MVFGMPDEHMDPSGNTQAFRAFANSPEAADPAGSSSKLPLVAGVAVAVIAVIVVVGWLVLS